MSDDTGLPTHPTEPEVGPRRRFSVEAAALGAGVVALLVAGIVTLLSVNGGGTDDQLTIGSEPDRPAPTFDASISDADEPSAGRDISITDEPIVIDADGNIVDPRGGNGGAALPSEAADRGDGADGDGDGAGLDLPDDAFTGSTIDVSEPAGAVTTDPDEDADDGVNLLGGDDPEDKLMPDLICRGLQAAQDEIQDRGVFGSKSRDATGQGRRQIWDRNWIVVAQDPEPGEKIGEFEAVLYVVKQGDDENICD